MVGGSVLLNRLCPSFRLSGYFLGSVLLVFSKFLHSVRNPYEVLRDRAGFSGEKKFCPKIGKMDQEWAKNMFF